MVMTLGDAALFLTTNSDGLKKGLDDAEGDTGSWVKRVGGNITTGLGGAFVGASTLAVGAIAGVGVAAFDMASEVDGAVNQMTLATDATAEQAAKLESALVDAFEHGVGDSVAEAGETITTVFNAAGFAARKLSDKELSEVAQQAQALSDVFGVDVSESVRTATQMVNTGFSPSFEDAFDTIATGFQKGVNSSDDFLDTLNEYSDDFADLELSGGEALGLLSAGLEGGAMNTDKIADAMNEFGVRIRDPGIRDGLEEIDGGITSIFDGFQSGETTEKEALFGMIDRLNNVDDAIKRDQLGVALFGSMWEDMGEDAILNLELMADHSVSTGGAIDSLVDRSRPMGERFEIAGRQIQTALIPVGEGLLEVAEEIMPLLIDAITNVVAPTIANFAENVLPMISAFIRDVLAPAIMFLSTEILPAVTTFISEVFVPAITDLADAVLPLISDFIRDVLAPALTFLANEVLPPMVAFISNVLVPVFLAFAEDVMPKIVAFINDVIVPAIKNFVENVLPTIVNFLQERVFPIIEKIITIVMLVWEVVRPIVEEAITVIMSIVEGLITFFQETIVPVIDGIFVLINDILSVFIALFEGDFESFGQFILDAIVTILDTLGGLVGDLITIAGDLVGELWSAFTSIDWLGLGGDIIGGIGQGILDGAGAVIDGAVGIAGDIVGGVGDFLGISSPSKLMAEEIGVPMGQGINVGMMDALNNNLSGVNGALLSVGSGIAGSNGGNGGTVVNGGLNISFAGGAPATQAEADMSAQLLTEALKRRGVTL